MCGIIGYLGPRPAAPILLEGLKRLEYRGYDSAGLAVLGGGALRAVKRAGKIANLESALGDQPPPGDCGIAHTRWATHGAPTEANAHPQLSEAGDIAVVHNGIIENADRLREWLRGEGFRFRSETDTEVVAHLVDRALRTADRLEDAVRDALARVEGTYGIAVVSSRDPDRIVVAAHGSPLLLGIGAGEELFAASDAAAVSGHAQRVVRLTDGDVAVLTREGYQTFDRGRRTVTRRASDVGPDAGAASKNGYAHFMYKEISEQPGTLRDVLRGRLDEIDGVSRLGGITMSDRELRQVDRVVLTACGTSRYAGMIGARMIEDLARVPAAVEYASEFRYSNPVLTPNTLVIGISQSGETADTLAALREARRRGCRIMGIVNTVASTIAVETDFGVYLHAGPEIGVASTKSFTSQLVALALFALYLGRRRHLSLAEGRRLVRALGRLPDQMEAVLLCDRSVRRLARRYRNAPGFLFLGRGYQVPVALEGALKLKEVSYLPAAGIPAGEMKHGPIALVDRELPVVVLATRGEGVYQKVLSNLEEVRARGGRIVAVVNDEDPELARRVEHRILLPRTDPRLMPVLTAVPLQLLAYHAAVARGADVDQPRNLAKSVTVE